MAGQTPNTSTESFDGYAVPAGRYRAPRMGDPKYLATLGVWVLGLVTVMMVLTLIDHRVVGVPTRYVCPPDCGRPPTGLPVSTNPRFTPADEAFSVSYPVPGTAYDVTLESNGVTARLNVGDGGTMRLFSEAPRGRDAEQITTDLLTDAFPGARVSYELPNATVGFQPGYGIVADFVPLAAASAEDRVRIILIVAVKNDLALVAAAQGPFLQFTPSVGPGPPSPANVQIAQDMGKYVNSFRWRGDPPR